MPIGITAGQRLRDLRNVAGLSMAAAAEKIGCDQSYLSKLESGSAKRPSADFLRRAAAIFQVNEDWLASGVGDPQARRRIEEQEQLEQDVQFIAAITTLLQHMTVIQLARCAQDIGDNHAISNTRKAFWMRILFDWIAVKGRIPGEVEEALQFELDRAKKIHNKWILRTDSRMSHWENLRRNILVRTAVRGARAELARTLKVSPQVLNEWLQGRNAPPAEQTLRLLRWVEQDEGNKKDAGSAETRPALKTRKNKSTTNEKAKSDRKKQ